jgi:hypothetical protein
MQSTYLEVELDEGSEGRPELRLHVALAHEMERRPLRRCEGLEEAELLCDPSALRVNQRQLRGNRMQSKGLEEAELLQSP